MNDQFDFWLGEWDLTWGENGRGYSSVSRILNDKVIREKFTSEHDDEVAPFEGMSISSYQEAAQQWKQNWLDNQGNNLDFVGHFVDGEMILQREAMVDGHYARQRMMWTAITPTSLEWYWQQSNDHGQTWQTLWHIHYTRKA